MVPLILGNPHIGIVKPIVTKASPYSQLSFPSGALGLRGLGFRGLGFRGLGVYVFTGLGLRGLGV